MTKVSVIIPIYNTEKYLKRCLDSVCNQTLSDIEIICINDCSTDNSLEILREYSAKDERVKVIDFKKNKGAAVARNIGIDEAQGEYIGFVDSDDFVDLDFYEKLYTKAIETGADIVKGEICELAEDGSLMESFGYDINDEIRLNKAYFYHSFTSAIYHREFLLANKIRFPESISHFEDPYFAIKSAIFCNKIEIVDEKKYYYQRHSQSETNKELGLKIVEETKKSILLIVDGLNNSSVSDLHYSIVSGFLHEHIISLCKKTLSQREIYNEVLEILKQYRRQTKKIKFDNEPQYVNPSLLLDCYKKYDFLNSNNQTPLVKVFVSYIKPAFLFKSEILTPIHLGRAVEKENSKDGLISEENLEWLHENCIGDNDFVGNISHINRRVGFLTGTYWAWKNYEKLGNPEYFGSFGYRKLLTPNFLNELKKYDFITPEPTEMHLSLKRQFIYCHGPEMYKTTLDIIKEVYPEEISEVVEYFKQGKGYFYEIYVMKKELFFDFCEWIFKILFRFIELYDNDFIETVPKYGQSEIFQNLSKKEFRDVAFIMERLTGYYLYKLTKNKMLSYKSAEVLSPEEKSSCQKTILKTLREKIKQKV